MYALDEHKCHLFPDAALSLLEGKPVAPLQVEISPTSICNQRCIFCAFDYLKRRRNLDTDIMIQLIQDLPKLEVKSVVFAGEGEPLLNKGLEKAVNACEKNHVPCAMSTNGALLTQERAKAILPKLTWCRISINSTGRLTYERIHGRDDLPKVRKNVEYALKHKGGCTLGAQILLLPENADEFLTNVYQLCEMGFDYVSIKPYSHHPFCKHEPQDVRAMKSMVQLLLTMPSLPDKVYFREKAFRRLYEPKPYDTCLGGPLFCFVAASGHVYPCAQFVGQLDYSMGRVHDRSMLKIVFSEQAQKVRKRVSCLNVQECRSPCRLDAVNAWLSRAKDPKGHDLFL